MIKIIKAMPMNSSLLLASTAFICLSLLFSPSGSRANEEKSPDAQLVQLKARIKEIDNDITASNQYCEMIYREAGDKAFTNSFFASRCKLSPFSLYQVIGDYIASMSNSRALAKCLGLRSAQDKYIRLLESKIGLTQSWQLPLPGDISDCRTASEKAMFYILKLEQKAGLSSTIVK